MRKGLCFAGNAIADQIKFVEQYPCPGTLTTITSTGTSLGGLLCNCALDTARLDPHVPVSAIGVVGQDGAGEEILKQLQAYPSIDISGIRRCGTTSFTDVVTETDGRRTFFHFRGSNALLGPDDFLFERIRADILHIGYILLLDKLDGPDPQYETALCRVLADARKHGIRTSVDVVSEEGSRFSRLVPPALRYTDYCFLNEIEAERTTGIVLRKEGHLYQENFLPCLRALAAMGVERWAVIHMPELAYGLDMKTGSDWCEPSFALPEGFAVSSVGAGDAFAAGMLLGAYYGWSLRKAMHMASAVAGYSLSGRGASDAMKPLAEILAEMAVFQKQKIGG